MVSRLIWRCVLRDTMIPRFAALESHLHFSEDCCRCYIVRMAEWRCVFASIFFDCSYEQLLAYTFFFFFLFTQHFFLLLCFQLIYTFQSLQALFSFWSKMCGSQEETIGHFGMDE